MFHSPRTLRNCLCQFLFFFFLYLHLSQSVLQILRICFSTGLSYALVLFLSAEPRVERHNLILVLLVPLQQTWQTATQLWGLWEKKGFQVWDFRNRASCLTEVVAFMTHLGVQVCVSVISILQLISDQLLGAAQCWIWSTNLLLSSLDGVQNLLTRDGDEAQVCFVANDILTKLQWKQIAGSKCRNGISVK